MGNNCRHLTRVLLANNPLSEKLPDRPSWQKPDARAGKPGKDKRKAKGANQENPGRNQKDNRRRD